ncbi:chaperone modulator CbpM [Ravibacter arvi]
MKTEMISVTSYCRKYDIERTFIESLAEGGLIEVVFFENERFLPFSVLPQLEKYIRWHYELDINSEGIETIQYLLYKIDLLKREVAGLQNRLKLYED